MSKIWKIFIYEYSRHVLRKRFIFAIISIPFFIAVVIGISIISTLLDANRAPIGYIDHSGVLQNPAPQPPSQDPFSVHIAYVPIADETQAEEKLRGGEIQGYYILSPDYLDSGRAKLVYLEEPDQEAQEGFLDLLRLTLMDDQPEEVARRLTDGSTLIIQSADGTRRMAESDWFNILIPLLVGVLFIFVVMTSGGYLLSAVVEEKENRTIEIIVTSVSPGQLMAGKILGNMSVGLTQLLVWMVFILAFLLIGRRYFDWIERLQFGMDFLVLMVITLLPAFVLISALMATIGATVTEEREAQQISGLFAIPITIPYWFTFQIMTNPNGPFAIGLSFFPITAPVTITMRAGFTQIPPAQLALNLAILYLAAFGAIWLAARAFRLGMLSYGKRISLRQILRKSM